MPVNSRIFTLHFPTTLASFGSIFNELCTFPTWREAGFKINILQGRFEVWCPQGLDVVSKASFNCSFHRFGPVISLYRVKTFGRELLYNSLLHSVNQLLLSIDLTESFLWAISHSSVSLCISMLPRSVSFLISKFLLNNSYKVANHVVCLIGSTDFTNQ